jgi:fido (protein-threonine AMPylation protein)
MANWESVPGETPIDPSGLKIRGITTRRELSVVEAECIRKVVVKYIAAKPSSRSAPFNLDWFLRLHKEMFGDVWVWAGKIRTVNLNLGSPFGLIRDHLYDLVENLNSWPGYQMDFAEQAARLHHRAVQIHPFENGNGRWSRMLANIWLRRHKQALTEWPEATIGEKSVIRESYIEAIQRADAGDLDPLISLHRTLTQRSAI